MGDLTPAKIILGQLQDGSRGMFSLMTGAKNFTSMNDGRTLFFSIGSNPMGVNRVTITLNGMDLYDVAFQRLRGLELKPLHVSENVYAEDLLRLFREHTGMETSMGRRTA